MNKRDYYYLREVILGLRLEYLKNKSSLDDLKKHIIYDRKKIDNINLRVLKDSEEKLGLICYLEKRKNKLKEILNYFSKTEDMGLIIEILKNNEYYNIKSINENLRVDNLAEFNNEVEKILNSFFNNNIKKELFDLTCGNMKYNLHINNHKIEVETHDDYLPDISYIPDKDVISILDFSPSVFPIYRTLNLEVPKSLLSNYHINVIDSSKALSKNVFILPGINFLKDTSLNIHEDDFSFVLKKSYKNC